MVLYDYSCNLENEAKENRSMVFTFDDIDTSLSKAKTIRYSQPISIHPISSTSAVGMDIGVDLLATVTAYPAGRTIGGSTWCIRCGTAEIVYAMDINLKRDSVLDGATLDLPASPSLLIVEGGCANGSRNQHSVAVTRRKRLHGGAVGGSAVGGGGGGTESIISSVMDTVRMEGNVLIPVETASRTLELLHTLGKFWTDQKLFDLYHLVLLSPMGLNVVEFARSELEWMSESLSKDFYLGKPNPFSFPQMHIFSSLKQMSQLGPGPKVCTDAVCLCL